MMFGRTTTAHHTFFNLKVFKFYLVAITDKSHEESAAVYKIRGVSKRRCHSKLCPKKIRTLENSTQEKLAHVSYYVLDILPLSPMATKNGTNGDPMSLKLKANASNDANGTPHHIHYWRHWRSPLVPFKWWRHSQDHH